MMALPATVLEAEAVVSTASADACTLDRHHYPLEGAVHGLTLEIAGLRSMVLDHDRKLRGGA